MIWEITIKKNIEISGNHERNKEQQGTCELQGRKLREIHDKGSKGKKS